MTRRTVNLQAAARTDVGRVRQSNEDAFTCCPDSGVFVVCDGMGGAAAGEIASRIAVDTLKDRLCAATSHENRRKILEEAIVAANRSVLLRAEKEPQLQGMGTTLVALAIADHRALVAHVGDSRCYLYRAGELSRQTNDHSLVDEQVRLGQLTQEEASRSPLRNVITRAIGTQQSVSAEIGEIDLESGDLLLLCSDGLTRELDDDRLAEILHAGGPVESMCRQFIDDANAAGGRDNVTALLISVQ
jgi:serine/threonine protein phosphatase PrpC